jgi:hypothetical protein
MVYCPRFGLQDYPAAKESKRMWMSVGKRRCAITLTDNAVTSALAAQLPLTLDMSELNGNEKHARLAKALPANASPPGTIPLACPKHSAGVV